MDEWSLSKVEKDNGEFWVIRKNLHPLPESKNTGEYPICVLLTFHYQPFSDEGFPSTEDNDAFETIENNLVEICNGLHSAFVATVFMPKLKDFIIYTSNPDKLSDLIGPMVKPYNQFRVEFGGNNDPNWNQYESFT